MEFEVASIRRDTSDRHTPPNIALTADDGGGPSGGLFVADDPLMVYIEFAYKLWLAPSERESILARLPKWVSTDTFEIHARAPGNPTKDQMRLMMQSLLASRFKLGLHRESQVVSVFALTLVKPGKIGANIRPHAEGPPCDEEVNVRSNSPIKESRHVFPQRCGVYSAQAMSAHSVKLASRNTTLTLFAKALPSYGHLDRPVVDRTGIAEKVDISLEWTATVGEGSPSLRIEGQSNGQETTFLEALKEQLGLKLESTKAPSDTLVIDHVEQPSDN
jgi:uncharacterized protein (TIGR03435 family)